MYKKIEHIKHEIQKDLLDLVTFDLKSNTNKIMNDKNLSTSQV